MPCPAAAFFGVPGRPAALRFFVFQLARSAWCTGVCAWSLRFLSTRSGLLFFRPAASSSRPVVRRYRVGTSAVRHGLLYAFVRACGSTAPLPRRRFRCRRSECPYRRFAGAVSSSLLRSPVDKFGPVVVRASGACSTSPGFASVATRAAVARSVFPPGPRRSWLRADVTLSVSVVQRPRIPLSFHVLRGNLLLTWASSTSTVFVCGLPGPLLAFALNACFCTRSRSCLGLDIALRVLLLPRLFALSWTFLGSWLASFLGPSGASRRCGSKR